MFAYAPATRSKLARDTQFHKESVLPRLRPQPLAWEQRFSCEQYECVDDPPLLSCVAYMPTLCQNLYHKSDTEIDASLKEIRKYWGVNCLKQPKIKKKWEIHDVGLMRQAFRLLEGGG